MYINTKVGITVGINTLYFKKHYLFVDKTVQFKSF